MKFELETMKPGEMALLEVEIRNPKADKDGDVLVAYGCDLRKIQSFVKPAMIVGRASELGDLRRELASAIDELNAVCAERDSARKELDDTKKSLKQTRECGRQAWFASAAENEQLRKELEAALSERDDATSKLSTTKHMLKITQEALSALELVRDNLRRDLLDYRADLLDCRAAHARELGKRGDAERERDSLIKTRDALLDRIREVAPDQATTFKPGDQVLCSGRESRFDGLEGIVQPHEFSTPERERARFTNVNFGSNGCANVPNEHLSLVTGTKEDPRINELKDLAAAYAAPCPFNVGDIVTYRPGHQHSGDLCIVTRVMNDTNSASVVCLIRHGETDATMTEAWKLVRWEQK